MPNIGPIMTLFFKKASVIINKALRENKKLKINLEHLL